MIQKDLISGRILKHKHKDLENLAKKTHGYGYLYNWYVVADSREIAPYGWRVPSDSDFEILITNLGGENVAGGKCKSTNIVENEIPQGWKIPNIGATNETGFNALGTGQRGFNGIFYPTQIDIWYKAGDLFWSTNEAKTEWKDWWVCNDDAKFQSENYNKKNGFAIRLIMTNPSKWHYGMVVIFEGTAYNTVRIGSQVWLAENLAVTRYRNGDLIPNITDASAWSELETGAYCSYNNDKTESSVNSGDETKETILSKIGDIKAPSNWKTYKALLTQTEFNIPIARILNQDEEDYLGDVEWMFNAEGQYSTVGLFDASLTIITPPTDQNSSISTIIDEIGKIWITTTDTGTFSGNSVNGILWDTPIEIKVRQRGLTPILLNAETNTAGTTITLTFDKVINNYNLTHALSSFLPSYDGGLTAISCNDKNIILSIAPPLLYGVSGLISFDAINKVESIDFGLLGVITEFPITNNTEPIGLFLKFTSLSDASLTVGDATNKNDWNTFFDLPTNGDIFSDLVVYPAENKVCLIPSVNNIILRDQLFYMNQYIQEVDDAANCIVEVKSITFTNAENLFSFSSAGLISIGAMAFQNTDSLTNFYTPNLHSIGAMAFYSCRLAEFDLPKVEHIGYGCFIDCSSINTIYIPKCINLGENAGNNQVFNSIRGRIITLTIPSELESDGDITDLKSHNTVNVILAPKYLEFLFTDISYANYIVGDAHNVNDWNTMFVMYGDLNYQSVTIEGNLVKLFGGVNLHVNTELFRYTDYLISINDAAKSIYQVEGNYMFYGNSNLQSVIMNNNRQLNYGVFTNCNALTYLSMALCTTIGGSGDQGNFSGISGKTITIIIPSSMNTDGDITYLQAHNNVTIINP